MPPLTRACAFSTAPWTLVTAAGEMKDRVSAAWLASACPAVTAACADRTGIADSAAAPPATPAAPIKPRRDWPVCDIDLLLDSSERQRLTAMSAHERALDPVGTAGQRDVPPVGKLDEGRGLGRHRDRQGEQMAGSGPADEDPSVR